MDWRFQVCHIIVPVQVPSCWPQHGDVKFANLSLRYDANRERVITDLNLHIPAGQKVGYILFIEFLSALI